MSVVTNQLQDRRHGFGLIAEFRAELPGRVVQESDRRIGERMVSDEVRWLGAKATELLNAYAQLNAAHKPLTFDQVEEIWERDVRPRLKTFETMQNRWGNEGGVPEDSRWYAQWHVPDRG